MNPLAPKVAAKFLARLKKAREGEIASNPVIDNMADSGFVSEGFKDPEEKPAFGAEGEFPPEEKAQPVKEKAQV